MFIKQVEINGAQKWARIPVSVVEGPHVETDGTQRHRGWFKDPANRKAAGFAEIPDPTRPDDRFNIVTELDFADTPDGPWFHAEPRPAAQIMAMKVRDYEAALDAHLDSVAREYRYDNRFTFALRAGYEGPYKVEGVAFAQWMDACNTYVYALLQQVSSGTVDEPTKEEFIDGLPVFVKPGV